MKRLLLLAALAYALVFWALLGFTGRLLVLVLPLVLGAAAGLLFGPERLDLRIERTLSSDRVREETPVTVTLRVTNGGARLEEVHIEDALLARLRVLEGDTRLTAALGPGETVELAYTVQGRRGSYPFNPVRISACDLLGLFQRQAAVGAAGAAALTVLPGVVRLRHIDIRPRQTRVFAGTIPARVGGYGTEFFGVRAYQPADALRHVNWRANARHPGALYTNEFQQERIADVGLILDARERTNVEAGGQSLFEYGVMAAAALAEVFLSEGNRVGLLVYGHVLDRTTPGYGKVQRERILRALARARTGESQVFDKLEYLPTTLFPPRLQLVLVSPLCAEDADLLVYLRGRGYELIVVSPDPVRFEAGGLPAVPEVRLAARMAAVERALLFRRLRQAGVRLVDWDVSQPLEQAASAGLARQPMLARPVGIVR